MQGGPSLHPTEFGFGVGSALPRQSADRVCRTVHLKVDVMEDAWEERSSRGYFIRLMELMGSRKGTEI